MKNKPIAVINLMVMSLCTILFLCIGCGDGDEERKPQQNQVVKRQIDVPKQPAPSPGEKAASGKSKTSERISKPIVVPPSLKETVETQPKRVKDKVATGESESSGGVVKRTIVPPKIDLPSTEGTQPEIPRGEETARAPEKIPSVRKVPELRPISDISKSIESGKKDEGGNLQPLETIRTPDIDGIAGEPGTADGDAGKRADIMTIAHIPGIEEMIKPYATVSRYDPTKKVDPFQPLFKDEAQKTPKNDKNALPKTPLEQVDLSQLKLVAIIRADSGNRALVEQASGKGFILEQGTFVGIHSGKVKQILKDRVVIEEEIEDYLGNITVRKRELTLKKPPGEGYHEL